ncbi:MAG: PAS domain S-box protein [Spirochaetes bacterium]|nr:PAS domain S-box protein [Spirochaetota bacterium]
MENFNLLASFLLNSLFHTLEKPGALELKILITLSIFIGLIFVYIILNIIIIKKKNNEIKKINNVLQINETIFRDTFDNISIGIVHADLDGIYVKVNNKFAEIVGYSKNEILDKSYRNFVYSEDIEKNSSELKALLNGSVDSISSELRFIKKNGELVWCAVNVSTAYNAAYNSKYFILAVEDISKKKKTETTLYDYRQKFSLLMENTNIGFVEYDLDFNVKLWNPACERIFGYSEEEIINSKADKIIPEYARGDMLKLFDDIISKRNGRHSVNENITKNGEVINCEWFNTPLIDKNSVVTGVISIVIDVTDIRQMNETLKQNENKLKYATELAGLGVWEWDMVTDKKTFSKELLNIYGIEEKDVTESTNYFNFIHPEDFDIISDKFKKKLGKRIKPGDIIDKNIYFFQEPSDFRIVRPDGDIRYVKGDAFIQLNEEGFPYKMLGVLLDITDQKLKEEEVRTSLLEKEALIKEIHHRVKNNMQIISSLLELKKSKVTSEESISVINDSKNRIKSMALIHEKLYSSKNLANINLSEYIADLSNLLLYHYDLNKKVKINLDLKNIQFDINAMVPIGLLLNELLTNSLKYAFNKSKNGNIFIKLESDDMIKFELTYSDDGPGLPKDFDIDDIKTLGFQLIKSLIYQLEGEYVIDSKKGFSIKIIFEL